MIRSNEAINRMLHSRLEQEGEPLSQFELSIFFELYQHAQHIFYLDRPDMDELNCRRERIREIVGIIGMPKLIRELRVDQNDPYML
mmetsp:Transcript_35532/g.6399  ORF Transcript_35532/g.6399 Transcript_35532/m.6399 type:complete len:86 (-) Transcript_35532:511-768(-)